MKPKKNSVPADQILFAIPAALYIVMPLLDIFIHYFQEITNHSQYETFVVIPYLPAIILAIMVVALAVRLITNKDRRLVKKALQRTYTFQTTLLFFVMYMGLVLMSIGVNGFTDYAVHGHPYTKMSMWTYMANVLLFLFFSSLIYDERVKGFLVKACCIIATLYALYSMVNYNIQHYSGWLRGTFHNSNHYGYYLAVSISLTSAMIVEMLEKDEHPGIVDAESRKLMAGVWCVMMAIQCFALGYNNTLGAWIAVFMTHVFLLAVYGIRDRRFNGWVFVPFAIFIAMTIISAFFTVNIFTSILRTFTDLKNIATGAEEADRAGSSRWIMWRLTVKHIIATPIFGDGIEGLLATIGQEGGFTGSPHNEYLEYMAFFGAPAGICYIIACVSVFTHGLKYKKELNAATLVCMAGGFGYLVSAFFGVCFYYTVTYPFVFLGLALNFTRKDRPVMPEIPPAEEPTTMDMPTTDEVANP